jgi:hypothetical protein
MMTNIRQREMSTKDSVKRKKRFPWAQERLHTAVRLTKTEAAMLRALVRKHRISQNAILAMGLRKLHEETENNA